MSRGSEPAAPTKTGMFVRVTEHDERFDRDWEGYVARHPKGTLFHTLIWRDAVREAFGHQGRYLSAWRGGDLVGVFPLMLVRSRLAGRILVSVPYGVYGGTLADDDDAHTALLEAAQQLAEQLRCQWIDIRSIEPQWPQLPVVHRYVTFRKQLPDDPARVLSELPRKARAAARHGRDRHRLEAVFDDSQLGVVWSLYSKSMRRLASPNYPLRFFTGLMERTVPAGGPPDDAQGRQRPGHLVQVIYYQGRPIAGLLSFTYRATLMPYFAGCDERYERVYPNNYLYLTIMERGVELGCRTFDFGRSRLDNTGAYNFKRFQGFEPTPLHYQYYVPRGGRVPDLHPGSRRIELAQRVWSRLPLAVTRPLGAWLAKSIPG